MEEGKPILFNPDLTWQAVEGVELETSLLSPDEDGMVSQLVYNRTGTTKKLRGEDVIGTAEPVELEQPATRDADVTVQVSMVSTEAGQTSRESKVVELVDVCAREISTSDQFKLQQCIKEASTIFAIDKTELGEVSDVCHSIETGDSAPVRQAPRRIPFSMRSEVTEMVNEMLKSQVIEESSSPWASPIVLVRKKDGQSMLLR